MKNASLYLAALQSKQGMTY